MINHKITNKQTNFMISINAKTTLGIIQHYFKNRQTVQNKTLKNAKKKKNTEKPHSHLYFPRQMFF